MKKKETLYLSASEENLHFAARLIQKGGTVIFPTETVYGLGADALNPDATAKIFTAKGRPSDNPLIVHIADTDALKPLVKEVPEVAEKLIQAFWPGPLTLIFQKSDLVPKTVTGGLDTVAVRMPNQPVARRFLEIAKIPVAAPSANLSGKPSPTDFEHCKDDMTGRVDAIIDGGRCQVGVESTVLDISTETPVLYRPGGITLEQIEALIGPVKLVTEAKEGESPKSPGLKYKHYAPNAEVQILRGSMEEVQAYIKKMAESYHTAVLTFDEFPQFPKETITYSLGSKNKPEDAANRLFAAFRELDAQNVAYIFAPEIPESGFWHAVRNRMYRAAGNNVIDLSKEKKEILFLCSGNTCRSPMAEGILNNIAKEEELSVCAVSAGLFAVSSVPSEFAILAMHEIGIDITAHRAQQLTAEIASKADRILTMTKSHAQMVELYFPQYKDKVCTLSEWAEEDADVPDPYGGSIEKYRSCRDEIKRLITKGRSIHL